MTKNIVLVDDDEKIAELTGQSLASKGYKIEVFTVATEALEFIKANPDFNFLISDNIMPCMNGQELINEVLAMDKNIKCILATGDDSSGISFSGHENLVTIVPKPFKRKDLIAAIESFED